MLRLAAHDEESKIKGKSGSGARFLVAIDEGELTLVQIKSLELLVRLSNGDRHGVINADTLCNVTAICLYCDADCICRKALGSSRWVTM